MKTCYEIPEYNIKLEQRDNLSFRVTYGLEVKDNLSYEQACMDFGSAVFHTLACDGKLDNSL